MWASNSGLLLVDFQNEWKDESSVYYLGRTSIVEKKAKTLVHEAIKNQSPIAYTKKYGDNEEEDVFPRNNLRSDIIDEIPMEEGIEIFGRKGWDPFIETYVDDFFIDMSVEHLYIAGLAINAGVRECVESAYNRGYSVTLVKDCCLAETSEEFQFTVEDLQKYRFITVKTLKQVIEQPL